jgi:hypothetical protein
MTRSRTPRDLRERMERVAAKSRRPPEGGTVRRAARPATAGETHDEGPPPAPADVLGTEPRSRAETLLAWGLWEVTEVPAQRWKWFKTTIRGGETQSKQRKRGGPPLPPAH